MLFFIGAIVGVVMTAPVGPVNIMCLRAALSHGFWAGMIAASGAVLADALYASAAAFGVTAVRTFIEHHQHLLQLLGALVVIAFGVLTLRNKPNLDAENADKTESSGPLLSFAATITNPGTIFGFIAIIGGLGRLAPDKGDLAGALILLAGIVTGCVFWWSFVAGIAARYRSKISQSLLQRVNLTMGIVLIAIGVAFLLKLAAWN